MHFLTCYISIGIVKASQRKDNAHGKEEDTR